MQAALPSLHSKHAGSARPVMGRCCAGEREGSADQQHHRRAVPCGHQGAHPEGASLLSHSLHARTSSTGGHRPTGTGLNARHDQALVSRMLQCSLRSRSLGSF